MFRKVIFIGQSGNDAVYFDVRNLIMVKASKNKMLDMPGTKNSGRNIILTLALMHIGGIGVSGISIFHVRLIYTMPVLIVLVLLWLLEIITLTYLVEKALYGPIKGKKSAELKQATKSEFRNAIKDNNLWNNFANKKATVGKEIGMYILMLVVVGCSVAIAPLLIKMNSQGMLLGHKIGGEFFGFSLVGVLLFSSVLLIWINNPVRWLRVVHKYQNKKL